MIKLQVIGHLGKDCITNTVNGKSVMNFTVAHSEKYRDAQNNQMERTIWLDCSYWTDKTGIAPYLKKGTQIYAEGAPDIRTYPKNDGTTGATMTLRVFSIQLLGSKPEGGTSGSSGGYQSNQGSTTPASVSAGGDMGEPADDLPF